MRSKFDEQLRLLNQEMMYMGTMIEDSIQKAIEALIAQNAQLAEKIMNSDSDVDHEQKKIENICFNLLMQQQPVARDLRVISAAMKMVTNRRPCSRYLGNHNHAFKRTVCAESG